MFTWWNQPKNSSPAHKSRYRPVLENLERRETPAVAVNVGATINISQAIGNQKAPSVVVNPLNPDQVVAFANIEDITGDNTAEPGLFEAWSSDGGQTWNTQYLFTDPAGLDRATRYGHGAWDRFGNLFVAYQTGTGNIAVATSTDGGASFFSQVLTSDGLQTNSRVSIATGPAFRANLASVYVSYRVDANPMGVVVPPHLEVVHAYSSGLGLISAFSGRPEVIPGSDSTNPGPSNITIGPGGRVMVVYESTGSASAGGPSQIWCNVDPDGLNNAPWGTRRLITATNLGPGSAIIANGVTANVSAAPNVVWNYGFGRTVNRGRVYVTYVNAPAVVPTVAALGGADTNVFLRYSDDNGLTWSAPLRVNDDTTTRSQFLPSLAVDQFTGYVAVSWYDARNSATNTITRVFAAISDDGGVTFGNNFQVSPDNIDAGASLPPAGGAIPSGVGEHAEGVSFVQGNLQVVWSDNSPGLPGNPDPLRMDTATARVRVAPIIRVKVIFPARWRLIDAANSIYFGRITILNNSGFTLRGPFTLTVTLPDPSMSFVAPANTQSGSVVTFTINSDLVNQSPLRLYTLLSNPLKKKLPSSLIGYATTLA